MTLIGIAATVAVVLLGMPAPASAQRIEKGPDGVTIVRLTQSPCVFVESEVNPKTYTSTRREDCEAINERTAGQRKLKTVRLRPGEYVFRVSNKDVPYEVGFWLRGQGFSRLTLPSVSGSGLGTGKTQDYRIKLAKGEYWYSCPLNPTPDYPLIVE